ncbi:MAG: valyl-tRNA synthetase [Pseudonocardiales bacterium]|jgi:valyl-tRNA synthetase|nr:valyl-tRNA synthetase [Pseudonocardiales bacterium]
MQGVTQTPPVRAELPSQYVPADVEAPLYERWVERGYFTAHPESDKPPFSIVIPPPNVTGNLHLGHALEHPIMDALTRRARMRGYDALWLPGMDHASIAVQNLVERHLAETEGKSRFDYTREQFIEKAWEWKAEYGGKILGQMRRLGDSVDWTRERFTMDAGLSRAVQTIFKKLYDDDLIYRAERIINWCPRDLTALSDIEVDHAEEPGELTSIRYGEGNASIVVATTRPETMLGDTAVAVNPDDERYRHLIGATVPLPLTNRRIPIVADEHVDPAFGTGAVKVTPAHDPNDFEIGKRHDLPMLTIMDERAVITAPGPFAGLDRLEARGAIIAALREDGRIVAEKRPYLHSVGHCSRCDTVVEPRLSLQWWVRVETLARAASAAVRDGRVVIEPASLAPRYFAWVDGLRDWCISRQLWWGHRIPVWYSPDGDDVCFGPDETPPKGWTQDEDVLDTWFSAALWPFSTMGWPEDTPDLRKYYPTTVLVTGYDILFFWVVRMMLFGLYAMDDQPPFRTVMLHGLVRDAAGKKMSKSRGNVIDPLVWVEAYGADAVRFSLLQGANPGADQAINEEWVVGARNFCNKLWNATRFALLNGATVSGELPETVGGADAWILSRLHAVIAEVDALYERYEFAKIADVLYHFAWDEVCDWYVELAKITLAGPSGDDTRRVLGEVLETLLRLLHPMVPFVTETLWMALTGGESVVIADWPVPDPTRADAGAEKEIAAVQTVVTEVRRFRSDQGVKPSQRVPARITGADEAQAAIRWLVRLDEAEADFAPTASLTTAGGVLVEFDLSGAIDVGAERSRLAKDLAAARKERDVNSAKLGNAAFTGKAPEAVIGKVRDRLSAAESDIARIEAALAALPATPALPAT